MMKKSLRQQLMWYMLFMAILVLVVSIISSSIIIEDTFSKQRVDVLSEKVRIIEYNISKKFQSLMISSDSLMNNDELFEKLNKQDKTSDEINRINEILNLGISTYNTLSFVYVVDNEGHVINGRYNNNEEYFKLILKEIDESGREEYFTAPNSFPFLTSSDKNYISYIRRLRDPKDKKSNFNLIIIFNKNIVLNPIWEKELDNFENVFIFSDVGDIIYQNNFNDEIVAEVNQMQKDKHYSDNIRIDDNVYFVQPINNYTNWKVVTSVNDKTLRQGYFNIFAGLCILGLILTLFVFFLSKIVTKKITKPIKLLQGTMAEFMDGNMTARVYESAPTEIEDLINGYNAMADRIVESIDELIKKHEEVQKAEIEALKFNYELLQNQINPHFLYNTLNTVSYLAIIGKTDEIQELIKSLNVLLRAVLNVDEEYVTLKREFEFLKSYVNIQNYRFDNPVVLEYDLPKELENVKILKLLLQPIIENSIIHGIMPKDTKKGRILIKVLNVENGVEIIIADNGIGMSAEEAEILNEKINDKGFNRIGLANINERIKMIYGSTLKISGYKNVGTMVYFQINKNVEE